MREAEKGPKVEPAPGGKPMNRAMLICCCVVGVIAASIAIVPGASALSISTFEVSANEGGGFGRRAGGHPDLVTHITFATESNGEGRLKTSGNARNFRVDLPPGF